MKKEPLGEGRPLRVEKGAVERIQRVRAWREKILAVQGDLFLDPSTSRADLLDLQFAASSLYLQYTWEFVSHGEPLREKLPTTADFWNLFYTRLGEYISEREGALISAIGYRREQFPSSPWTQLERITRLLLDLTAVTSSVDGREGAQSIPSMDALNNIGTHTIQALVECYEVRYKEPISREEFYRFTRNPSLKNMMVQWQINTKDAVHRMLQFLHVGEGMDPTSKFTTDAFEMDRDEAKFGFQPAFLSLIQARLQEYPGTVQEPLRACPVFYSRQFAEMWDWLIGHVSYQLFDTPYPVRVSKEDASSERQVFMKDLQIGVDPYLKDVKKSKKD